VKQTALVGLDTLGDNIPQDYTGGEDNHPFTGQNIAGNYPAYGYGGSGDIAFHSGPLANDDPARGRQVSTEIPVYSGKTGGIHIAIYAGIWSYYCVDREIFTFIGGHTD
jgi:hypothetical protein